MLLTALASWLASLLIPRTGEGAPNLVVNRNVLASTWDLIKELRADARLWWGAIVVSWFWLVGALVLSLLLPLGHINIHGTDGVITVFLTVFSVAVAVGSGLAAWLAAGRIVLLPTLIGAVLIGLFALDLGWMAHSFVAPPMVIGIDGFFAAPHSIRIVVDLAGLAIGGGLFVVPTFAAVQAWAGADHRARVVAGVNVLNAAFMVVGALISGCSADTRIRRSGLVRDDRRRQPPGGGRHRLHNAGELDDRFPFHRVPRLLPPRSEGRSRTSPRPAHNAIVALNHVSFLDPPLAMSLLPKPPVFAIDVAMSRHWWIKPFLNFVRTMALDPLKPFSLRTIINAVRDDGNMLVIFPEGRITVTGSLMKIYDGAGMIADKSEAMLVPVHIAGPEATIFSRLYAVAGAAPAGFQK